VSHNEVGADSTEEVIGEAPDDGCAAHGVALLIASLAAVVLMGLVTFGCWVLYRLFT
jgi:hypothetical protein